MSRSEDTWRERLEQQREEKDAFLGEHPQSPVPPEHRESFDGLSYYPPDPDYRVNAIVERHEDPESVQLETTAGPEQAYQHVATLRFTVSGEEHELPAYYREDQEGLFVPFRDATTGEETYTLGRYLDVDVAVDDLADGDALTVDFNDAYSPFCAYSETYSCPIPPEENELDTPIEAGEKDWRPVD